MIIADQWSGFLRHLTDQFDGALQLAAEVGDLILLDILHHQNLDRLLSIGVNRWKACFLLRKQ